MDSFTHKSPAKINTFLNVLSKRNDGYHNIYTHFELIDIFDDNNPENANTELATI